MNCILNTTKRLSAIPLLFWCLTVLLPRSGACQAPVLTAANANQVVDSLTRHCLSLYHPQPEQALNKIDSTIQMVVTSVGKNHPAYSRAIETKATMLTDSRKFAQADTLLQEAMQVLRILADTNTTQYAQLLYNCARLKKMKTPRKP